MKSPSIMATFSPYWYSVFSFRLIFSFITLTFSKPSLSLSFPSPHDNSTSDPNVILFGDAEISNAGSFVRLTRPKPSSSGLILENKPFTFLDSDSKPTSFSTDFTFSISDHNGDGLALIILPADFRSKFSRKSPFGLSPKNRFVAIEFDTSMNVDVGDENANHVGVDLCNLKSVKVSNVSSINLVLNSGMKLHSWVDFEASSKRLEVRLGSFGSARPYDPLLAYPIDLSEMWKEEEVFVGISSSNGNSMQTSSVHSWSFRVRSAPKWLHSLPVDPQSFSSEQVKLKSEHDQKVCSSGVFAKLIFVTGCGALAAFVMLFLWAIFGNRNAPFAVEPPQQPVDFRIRWMGKTMMIPTKYKAYNRIDDLES